MGLAGAEEICKSCHAPQYARHATTRHARALRPAAATEFAANLPPTPIGEARGGYLLHYQRQGDALQVTAERGKDRRTALLEWVFGAGGQGATPLVRDGARFWEHRISYYPAAGRYDLTLGHAPGPSRSAETALGVEQDRGTLAACLGCHSTVRGETVESPGVACSRCHSGAERHAKAQAAAGNPRKLTAKAEVALCAECHRLTPAGRADDPLNIRFQPLRLVRSRCYLKGGIRCTSCHIAHQDASSDPLHYRDRCLTCHAGVKDHAGQTAQSDCLPCHMPRSSPAPYLSFTDHFIRRR